MKKWIREHKKLSILIVVLAIVAAVAVWVGVKVNRAAEALQQAANQQETAEVEERTLVESLSATGTFVASDETNVTSETANAKVLSVNVSAGDTVNAGDVICTLDTTDLQEDLADAQQNLTDAEEQRQRTVDNATRSLEEAAANRDESLGQIDTDIADAYQDWQDAQAQLDSLNAQKNAVEGSEEPADVQLAAKLDGEIRIAQTTVDRAKRTYDTKVQNRDSDIKTVNDAYRNQEDSYQTTIENASSSTDAQQERVDELQKQIAGATVTAPARGLVTSVYVEAGDDYNGGSLAVIKNVDVFEITTEIDEYDINKVQTGQEVVIKTNATDDMELSGTVISVAPAATGSESASGSGASFGLDLSNLSGSSLMGGGGSDDVTYTVQIRVDTPCDQIRIGMTAKLSIVLSKAEDVLSVPYNAVQGDSETGYYVEEVLSEEEDGTYKTQKISVTKGLESDYYTQVSGDGVKEGMKILVPKAEGGNSIMDLLQQSGSMGGI